MTTPNADEQRWAARNRAYRAVFDLARAAGAQPITRPAYRGSEHTVQDVDPLAGLSASRHLELAARQHATDYIRTARQAGHTWHDIGAALDLVPDADPQQAGSNLGEAAFTYAAGNPDRSFVYDRSITWRCGSCEQPIIDYGLDNSPADNERGHADNCPQFAAAIEAWDAIEADWETGL